MHARSYFAGGPTAAPAAAAVHVAEAPGKLRSTSERPKTDKPSASPRPSSAEAARGAHARGEAPAAHEGARPQAAAEQRHERDGALVGGEAGNDNAQPSARLSHLTKKRGRLEALERRLLACVHEWTHEPRHERAVAPRRAAEFDERGRGVERAVALVAVVLVVGFVVGAAVASPGAVVVAVAVVRRGARAATAPNCGRTAQAPRARRPSLTQPRTACHAHSARRRGRRAPSRRRRAPAARERARENARRPTARGDAVYAAATTKTLHSPCAPGDATGSSIASSARRCSPSSVPTTASLSGGSTAAGDSARERPWRSHDQHDCAR